MQLRLFILLISSVLTAFAGGPCAAQVIHYLLPPQAPAAGAPAPACVARVVDARPARTPLGYTKMAGAVAQPLLFREELGKTLGDFFARYAPGQPQAIPLTMRLTELSLAETRGFTPTVTARMQAEFYLRRPDSSYALVASFARTAQQPVTGGPAATLVSHAANLGALLLSAAAVGGDQATWSATGPGYAAVPVAAVAASAAPTLAILVPDTQLQPGFYYSLADFTSNQPSEPGPPEVESRPYLGTEWAGDYEMNPYHQVNGRRVLATDVWGFCDGQAAYIGGVRIFIGCGSARAVVSFMGARARDPCCIRRSTCSRWPPSPAGAGAW